MVCETLVRKMSRCFIRIVVFAVVMIVVIAAEISVFRLVCEFDLCVFNLVCCRLPLLSDGVVDSLATASNAFNNDTYCLDCECVTQNAQPYDLDTMPTPHWWLQPAGQYFVISDC